MGSWRFAALTVLLLALALLPDPASLRVLQGEKPSPSEGAPAPTVATGGSQKELGQSSNAVKSPVTKEQHQGTPPPETPPKNSTPPPPAVAENKGHEGGAAKASAQSVPVPWTNVHKESPPPEGSGPTGETVREGGGSEGKTKSTEEMKKAVRCVDPVDTCSVQGDFTACLQVSQNASIGPFVIVVNAGQNDITVDIKATSNIDIDNKKLCLAKGISGQVNIRYSNPNDGEIILNVGSEHCVLHTRQLVSDWQQQFQQLAVYANRMNPIYGASFVVFTVILVGVVCACCKFARRSHAGEVPYQQLEMGTQVPNPSGAENTTSTVDGWEDGWDDGWDDEEAPAKPSDEKPNGSISANGLSLRSQTNSKDGWDVDWDD